MLTNWNRYHAVFAGIVVLLLLPVWMHSLVPLVDLPLHMARSYAFAHFNDDPDFPAYLAKSPHWVHNSASEIIISPLLRICSLERATQLFLTLYILLFAAGCHLLGRAVRATGDMAFGPPLPAMLPCLFLSYHSMYLYGYTSFAIGLAAAIFTLALRAGWGSRWTAWRVVVLTALTTVTYLFHLSAVAMLGFAWGLWTLHEWRRRGRLAWWDAASFLAFVPAGVLYLLYGRASSSGPTLWPPVSKILLHLLTGFTSYTTVVTGIAVFTAMVGTAAALWLFRGRLTKLPLVAGAAFFALFLLAPDELHSASDVSVRFVPLAFVLLAAAMPATGERAGAVVLGLVLAGLTVRQADIIVYSWRAGAEMERQLPSLDVIPRHALVYPYVWLDKDPAVSKRSRHFLHFSSLALPRRHARYANLALVPPGTWPLQGNRDFRYGVFIEPGGSFAALDWPRLQTGRVWFWTYNLPPAAVDALRPYGSIEYEDGPVRVFRIQEKPTKP